MSDAIFDVPKEQYSAVIRQMIWHEDDVTNHRIMWLLVGQGFIAIAYVSVKDGGTGTHLIFGLAGIIVALSAFLMFFRSYQARGYLHFLGRQAKQGALREEQLPLIGWPSNRVKGQWRSDWVCPWWFRQSGDLLEPWLLLPFFSTAVWMAGQLRARSSMTTAVILAAGICLSAVILSVTSVVLVWAQNKTTNVQ